MFVPIAVGFVGDMYTQKLLQALPPLLKLHWSSNFVFQCICICFEFAFDFSSNLNFLILWKPVLGRHTQEGFWAFTFRLEFYSKAFLCVFCISFCFFFLAGLKYLHIHKELWAFPSQLELKSVALEQCDQIFLAWCCVDFLVIPRGMATRPFKITRLFPFPQKSNEHILRHMTAILISCAAKLPHLWPLLQY